MKLVNRRLLTDSARAQRFQTWGLVAALLLLVSAVGLYVFGPVGLLLGAILALVSAGAQLSPTLLLRLRGARPLHYGEAPLVHDAVLELSRRAGVRPPEVHWIPTDIPNAMATGAADGPNAIAVTRGALSLLSPRELVGVLAHEIAHLRSGDTRLFQLTGIAAQSVVTALRVALWMTFIFALLSGTGFGVALQLFVIATVVPLLVTLLTAALSRTREFAADRTAVELTGDPRGLASALERLHRFERGWLRRLFGGPELPGALRSHPATQERVRRLLEISEDPRLGRVLRAPSRVAPQREIRVFRWV